MVSKATGGNFGGMSQQRIASLGLSPRRKWLSHVHLVGELCCLTRFNPSSAPYCSVRPAKEIHERLELLGSVV